MKISIAFTIAFFIITDICLSQSLIGFKGGFYHNIFFNMDTDRGYQGKYKPYDKPAFSIIYKGRKEKIINLGLSLDLQPKSGNMYFYYGGLGSQIKRDFDVNMQFLNLSIFPEFKIGKKNLFYLSAGPQLGWAVYARKSGHYSWFSVISGPSGPYAENENAMKDFHGVDIRLLANTGFEIPICQKFKMTIDATLSRGFTNIANGFGGYVALNTSDYGVFLGLMYKFDNFNLGDIIKKYSKVENVN